MASMKVKLFSGVAWYVPGQKWLTSQIVPVRAPAFWLTALFVLQCLVNLSLATNLTPTTKNSITSTTNTTTEWQTTKRKTRAVLQRFLVEPDDLTVNIGESVVLPCRVSNKAGTVQWTRDGFGLGTDPRLEGFPTYSMVHNEATGEYSLKISSVTLEDDATFQCQIGALDSVAGIRSQNAKLTVRVRPENPVIVLGDFVNAPPASQELQVLTTTAGTKIELTCEAHGGRPAAELSWLNTRNRVVKKGLTSKTIPMNDGKRVNAALHWVFEPNKNDHNKKVTCRSSHPTLANYSSASILLEVKYPPEVDLEVTRIAAPIGDDQQQQLALSAIASGLHGRVGDSLRLRCVADGNPGKETLEFQWFRDNQLIPGDHGQELFLENIDKSLNGAEIACHVSNAIGVGKASVTLNVAFGPSFLPSMEYIHGVVSGDTVRMACTVEGNPSPEVTWIKMGTSNVINSGPKLTIRNVASEQIGEYLCRASVKGFPEVSAIVYLRINSPPKIRKKNSHNYAVLGEPGHVECLVESVPSPVAVTWVHNGQIFTSGSANSIPTNIDINEERVKEEAVALRASFDIRSTMENDFGYYNCVVVNKYGSDWHVVSLSEQTSFSTIVIIILISISMLVFIVLTTIIFLLSIKHRNLIRQQEQQQDTKKSYLRSDESDSHNIYSTTNSTRTNSSSEKNGAVETGTIITHSGGSSDSPRSSTSSFPYLESSHSPGPNQTSGLCHHHSHLSSQHASSPFPEPPPPHSHPFFASMFDSSLHMANTYNHHHHGSDQMRPSGMSPLSGPAYATLNRPPVLGSPGLGPLPYVPMNPYSGSSPFGTSRDMYQANPYHVSLGKTLHATTLPTPPPSLAKELNSCISNNSIATHV